jgi:hypothetical protein
VTEPFPEQPFEPAPGSSFGVPPTGSLELPPIDTTPTTAAPVATTTTAPSDDFALAPVKQDKGPPRPWIRLVVLVPLCAAIGVGSVYGRRLLANRGYLPA